MTTPRYHLTHTHDSKFSRVFQVSANVCIDVMLCVPYVFKCYTVHMLKYVKHVYVYASQTARMWMCTNVVYVFPVMQVKLV